jgi:hypothetical protein
VLEARGQGVGVDAGEERESFFDSVLQQQAALAVPQDVTI